MDLSRLLRNTLVMVLAGGQGERLYPLTRERAKPAVPFGGFYRIIDFTLSNCLNSGLRRIYVLTQYKSDSLNRHVRLGWDIFNPSIGEYIETRPPQQRLSSEWYLGTAHAIYQNIYTLDEERPELVLILGGDHVYRMDYSRLLFAHHHAGADATVACVERPLQEAAGRLGVVSVDSQMKVGKLTEKPPEPSPLPGRSDVCLCSMGIYVFDTETLVHRTIEDAKRESSHDFARDVLPAMIADGDYVQAVSFEGGYWRDIGTLDAYWAANMDLVRVEPRFNLYDAKWPIRSRAVSRPPAKVVFAGGNTPRTEVHNSLIANGAIVSGARVYESILGADVRIEVGSRVERSIIMDGTTIGRNCTIRKAILDKDNCIPDNAGIGVDKEWDGRHFALSDEGVVVMPKAMPFPRT